MGMISGKEYKQRLDKQQAEIWIDGEKVCGDISKHPAFKGTVASQALLYDQQHQEELLNTMSFISSDGSRIGTSFLQPKTKEDLTKRRQMIQTWAKTTAGLLGRSPDYMNTVLMTFAASASLLEGKENCFPKHLTNFYETAREKDLSFTHTFINPQVNRSILYFEDSDKPIAAKVIEENENGIVVHGARLLATQGGMTDEILVFSPGGITDEANAFAFSIPSNTDGLKFICRESFVQGESTYNYPLSTRFEEMDSIVVFDHVLVPWDRVFFYNNLEVANSFKNESAFLPFTLHQVVSRQVVKAKFILGVAESIVNTINISEYEHVRTKVTEIITAVETMEALLLKSEYNAELDEFGLMRPELSPLQVANSQFPSIYPRITEIIQLLGSSGMVSIPTESSFHSDIRKDLDQYLQSATKNAYDRVKLFRLGWDLTMSPFGTRQTQYERFFFGSPERLLTEVYGGYNTKPFVDWVEEFLS
ncbi:4-hydroxyphenylacetate 3-monooxygenase, oxygenase component [Aquibacillus kalidii]|uniref:4-hydroxyphenylacetate 3-monooxygenase, oxygenase component n=1 Tax=Aquibacillus kalidii TaxID=2762597 RepID=UPI0016468CB0|nr:4-hydroxyphenylacetate 3-monooxygenase, oxygenase component [Aquibacillus kalidii]